MIHCLSTSFVDLFHLKIEDTVEKEKDLIHGRVGRDHTHALHPIMVAQGVGVRVLQGDQARAEVGVQIVMIIQGNHLVVGPPVNEIIGSGYMLGLVDVGFCFKIQQLASVVSLSGNQTFGCLN